MFDIPDFKRVKKIKLVIHSLLICAGLSLMSLMIHDVFSLVVHKRIEINLFFISIFMVFWLFIAIRKSAYQK